MQADQSDPAVRARVAELTAKRSSWSDPSVAVADIDVPGPHGPIRLRVYRPRGPLSRALLWAHGGGFGAGCIDMPEAHTVSGELARRAGALVVSVDYRLAGDGVRYPVPLNDVHAAWRWLTSDGIASLPGGSPAAVGGASAGAALALATALRARDERPADAVLLAYPFAHFPNPALDGPIVAEMELQPAFTRCTATIVEAMVRGYVGRISDLPPDALPGAARLDGLPATRISLSEYDDLRPSGELLERQLRDVGVPVSSLLVEGTPHGHLDHDGIIPPVEESLEFLAGGLRQASRRPGTQFA
ncbi:alpha/beta hydrolase fold domain-containing protein [Dactylosporangium sp. CA-233914]|uniref:alpha/beta hydrolase fold domain-containing protein n=1 Tax=Dactylosporangium sp. CA-233914 TaxID=3239934 RepID=UPI003D8A910A